MTSSDPVALPRPLQHLLILPTTSERAGTPYANAHDATVAWAAEHSVTVTTETPPGTEPDATEPDGLVVVRMISRDTLAEALDAHPSIRWVQLPFAGIEPFLDVIRAHPEIIFTSATGSYAAPVAEHALALTLALLRHLPERVRATSWGATRGTTLNGARITIVGGGGIGSELVRLFSTWDTHLTVVRRTDRPVAGADRTVTSEHLDETLPEADVVVLAAAATDQTRHLIGPDQLAAMQPSAVLVNVARGTLIDTAALVTALTTGQIAAAGLDVTDPEPLPDGHPLWELDTALITPHTADTPEMCIPLLDERILHNLGILAGPNAAETTHTTDLAGLVDPVAGY